MGRYRSGWLSTGLVWLACIGMPAAAMGLLLSVTKPRGRPAPRRDSRPRPTEGRGTKRAGSGSEDERARQAHTSVGERRCLCGRHRCLCEPVVLHAAAPDDNCAGQATRHRTADHRADRGASAHAGAQPDTCLGSFLSSRQRPSDRLWRPGGPNPEGCGHLRRVWPWSSAGRRGAQPDRHAVLDDDLSQGPAGPDRGQRGRYGKETPKLVGRRPRAVPSDP